MKKQYHIYRGDWIDNAIKVIITQDHYMYRDNQYKQHGFYLLEDNDFNKEQILIQKLKGSLYTTVEFNINDLYLGYGYDLIGGGYYFYDDDTIDISLNSKS